jgi:glycine betaine/proline transport system permease protein
MATLTGARPQRVADWVPRSPWSWAAVALLAVLAIASGLQATFPAEWQVGLAQWVDELDQWWRLNRSDNPLFTAVFRPMAVGVALGLAEIEAQLALLGWIGVVVLVGTVAVVVAGVRVAGVAVAALIAIGLLGQWDNAMTTLSQITVAVVAAVAIGVPIGVLAGRVRAVEHIVRPVLDAMQTVPAYVYLLPLVLLFGVGNPPAIIATIIYATPPVVRLTALGIRRVAPESIEVGNAVGATGGQLLRTVQLPLALPSIRIGINQTIMMALSMVVIGALIGASGLGLEVLRGLQTLDIGRSLDAGLAIVLLAVILDRITYAAGARGHRMLTGLKAIGVIVAALVAGRLLGATRLADEVPFAGSLSVATVADEVSRWASTTLFPLTSAFSEAVITFGLNPLRDALTAIPWWLLTGVVALIAGRVVGGGLALYSVVAFVVVGAIGVWNEAMNTFSQVAVATAISLALAVPLGIAASQSDTLDRVLRPILDGMQTLPAFVYLVPIVALFNVGRVPGIIASVIYALPPAVRMTNAGIRQVSEEVLEAARSQGATRWQLLRTVQLPLAKPTILMGVNQTTMMVLAGIIIAGLIGAGGLGIEAVRGLTRGEIGRGVVAGLAIVLLGIVLDRITQSLGGASDDVRERERAKMKTA